MNKTKSELRRQLKAQRKALSLNQAIGAYEAITKRCIELVDWKSVKTLHCYVPLIEDNEVDCWRVVEYAWENYPDIVTAVPVLNADGDYDSVIVKPFTVWTKPRRIPEPTEFKKLEATTKFDVILVPMVGFDESGHRIGHGQGWYDRFLVSQPSAQKIGICYERGLVSGGIPSEQHDVTVNYVVTEDRVYKIS